MFLQWPAHKVFEPKRLLSRLFVPNTSSQGVWPSSMKLDLMIRWDTNLFSSKKGNNGKQTWTCPFAFFCTYFVFSICFCFAFILFLPGKKQTCEIKAKEKQIEKTKHMQKNANGQVHVFHTFPFLTFLFVPIVSLPFFFSFEVLVFDFPFVFLFVCSFFKLKNIRINPGYWGEHNADDAHQKNVIMAASLDILIN